ncbi:MAG: DUF5916 domain-containing protein [Gemmatimonadota bacterium]
MQPTFRSTATAAVLLLCTALPALSQDRTARASVVDVPPVIDGILDEALWRNAPVLTDFIQRIPRDGTPASQPTEVRILQDGQALYVGVWLHDSEPLGIIAGERVRDYNLEQSDAVLLILDTFRDEQNAFVFGTNPAGIQYDGQVANSGQGGGRFRGGGGGTQRQQSGSGGGFNLNWDASWDVATSRDDSGWYAEFRIPFSTLRYAAGPEQVWGLNVVRRIRRLNEQAFWSPVPREFDQYRLNYAGALGGLEPPTQRLVQITPYALQRADRDYQAGAGSFDHSTEVGGDAKVQVTQGLTLDLTVNTDFAQVEVDEVQTNLTRFNISFPEKRPFFLENAGRFSVGGGGADLFFSRRIGLSPQGSVPILGGGRLSGRAAGLNIGALHIVTDELEGLRPQNQYSVVRLAQELPNRSRVGGAFMRRASDATNDWNRTYAIDGQVGIGEAISLSSYLARTETPGLDGRDHAFDLQGGYTSRAFRGTLSYREIGEDFNPELGFLAREGFRYGQAFAMTYHRPEQFFGIREIRPHASYFEYRNIATDFVQSAKLHLDSHFEWQDGMEFHPGFNWVKEGLEEPFEIAPGIVIPAGTYSGWEAQWVFYTDESSMFSFNGGVYAGSFLSGDRVNPYATVIFRPSSSFSGSVRIDHNDVNLPQGDFETNVLGLRLSYFVTPNISIQSLTQYTDRADIWSTNVRFGWLDDAGSGLFIVFNQANGFDSLARETPLNRSFAIKYSKLLNLGSW